MSIHRHIKAPPSNASEKPPSVAMPMMLLGLSALIAIGYVAYLQSPGAPNTSAPMTTTNQGGAVAVAPIVEAATTN
jgi:hypothetical protein